MLCNTTYCPQEGAKCRFNSESRYDAGRWRRGIDNDYRQNKSVLWDGYWPAAWTQQDGNLEKIFSAPIVIYTY